MEFTFDTLMVATEKSTTWKRPDPDQHGLITTTTEIQISILNSTDVSGRNSVPPSTNALYRNNGNGSFTDVTVDAGVNHEGYGFGCCVGDYDNDGFKDIYITNFGVTTTVTEHLPT